MNLIEKDILLSIYKKQYINQRELAERLNVSLGMVNNSLKNLLTDDYLDSEYSLTEKSRQLFYNRRPKNAIILAAGLGMRMVPINTEVSKGLIEVKGEVLAERTIRQLKEAGIENIYIVVGFMKEQYEYLMDMYGVELIVNRDYSTKNNIYSLHLAAKYLDDSYIIPCDVWCEENPYNDIELYSWYLMKNKIHTGSDSRVNRKRDIVRPEKDKPGNEMLGISYLDHDDCEKVKQNINQLLKYERNNSLFWESALWEEHRMLIKAKMVSDESAYEINTFEQLREIDHDSKQANSDVINLIADCLKVNSGSVKNIRVLKKGMTNRSFLFSCKGKEYIMRIPGEGTDMLINRMNEHSVYQAISDQDICEDIFYINPQNGYKISAYLDNVRVCNPEDEEDVKQCMAYLKDFHKKQIKVSHEFNLYQQIDFYESLWDGKQSIYRDYERTKNNLLKLKSFIGKYKEENVLTHIDAVSDNFLFANDRIYLIDWEYAGMQDPHVDIAMFAIYALYNREQVDKLIDIYFDGKCEKHIRYKIYCYIALAGLVWSNWCEYKRHLGVEFGDYSLRQYRYAKDYYRLVAEEYPEMEQF